MLTALHFVRINNAFIEERDSTGAFVAHYVYGDGIDEVLSMKRGATNYYYFQDGLGSTANIVNNAGTVIENYEYDVYGTPSISSTIGNPVMFTGRWLDKESGNYDYRARSYSPKLGRFLQRDPIGYYDSMNLYKYVDSVGKPSAKTNLYTYAENNPVNFIDPLGLWSLSGNIYDVVGGGFTIGKNPSGGWFFTLGGGVGLGAGISYDPNGKSPGWNPCDQRHGSSIGVAADIGAGVGPLRVGVGDNAGIKYFGGKDFEGYLNPPSGKGKLRTGGWRFGVGGSAGGQISFF